MEATQGGAFTRLRVACSEQDKPILMSEVP